MTKKEKKRHYAMKHHAQRPERLRPWLTQSRSAAYFAALTTALLNIAMFPRLDFGWLAYIAFIPVFLILPGRSPIDLFWYYLIAGLLFRLGNLYWIYHVIQHYSGLAPLLAAGILLLLCICFAIFWGLYGFLLGICCKRLGFGAAMLLAPPLWVVFEWLLNILKVPWCLSGYSQYSYLRIAQFASIFGVYGLSWLIVTVNSAFTMSIVLRRYYYCNTALALIIVIVLYGHYRIAHPVEGELLTVACVQGNIPQDVKIDYRFASEVNEKQVQMTKKVLRTSQPDIIVWSESSTLYALEEGGQWAQDVFNLSRNAGTSILVGSDSYVGSKVYNRAFLINKEGQIVKSYAKMYLVPFGEYVPFKSVLFFVRKVVPEDSDFSAGSDYTLFPLNAKKFAVQICFEVLFPQLSREFCLRGASLLTTITNDGWFGKTSAPYQHFAMAAMRAIETHRYMVRVANTGISGIIDPYGRILKQTDIFVPAQFTSKVKCISENTFYTKHGDILIYVCLFVSIAIIFKSIVS